MKITDRAEILRLAAKDLYEALEVYIEAAQNGFGCYPRHCSKESIKRRIKQLRECLLVLEKEIEKV